MATEQITTDVKGRGQEAEGIVSEIEKQAGQANGAAIAAIAVDSKQAQPFFSQVMELATRYPGRLALGCILDLSEAFGYYGMFTFLALAALPAVNISATQIPWFTCSGMLVGCSVD